MDENIFSGDLLSLQHHWENAERAKKFLSGGTRIKAVQQVLETIKIHILNNIWVDVASGSGFVQSQLDYNYSPTLFVGVDFSREMLNCMDSKYGERVQGSVFSIPFRMNCVDLTSMFFSLSDYPNLNEGLSQMVGICKVGGFISFIDYGINDEYWLTRAKYDGNVIDGEIIIGNINLRSLKDTIKEFPSNVRIYNSKLIKYDTQVNEYASKFPLQDIVSRSFSFVIAQKSAK